MTISFLQSKQLLDAGFVTHGFTRRTGGVSDGPYASLNLSFDIGDIDENVTANLRRLQEAVGVDLPLARVRQVHGNKVIAGQEAILSAWDDRPVPEADALVSEAGGPVKLIQVADCVPVLLACPDTRVTAAVHAGWRGAVSGVVTSAVRRMTDLGADPSRMIAVLGPSIDFPCYEVGEDVAKRLVESADPKPKSPGQYLLDLRNAVEVSLVIAGVRSDHIERVGGCTHCHPEEFFSYRATGGTCGRMGAFIA